MTPEAASFLTKARESLDEARQIAAIGLAKVAGRSAYYAGFHAAEALIFERTGRAAKSHRGVRSEFARLAKDDSALREFSAFLAQAYELKSVADYDVDVGKRVLPEDAESAIATADRMVQMVALSLGRQPPA